MMYQLTILGFISGLITIVGSCTAIVYTIPGTVKNIKRIMEMIEK